MDPLWPETCWSTFKYFIILIVSANYMLSISWIIKCLILKKKFDSLSSTLHKSVQIAEVYVEIWHQTLQE